MALLDLLLGALLFSVFFIDCEELTPMNRKEGHLFRANTISVTVTSCLLLPMNRCHQKDVDVTCFSTCSQENLHCGGSSYFEVYDITILFKSRLRIVPGDLGVESWTP